MTRGVAAVLVAAGSGTRLGADVPKAFVQVGGRSLLEHAAARFAAFHRVVVAPADWIDTARRLTGCDCVPGGATRQESVDAGLAALPSRVSRVLVHDVARPFVPDAVIARVLAALEDADAAIPALPVTDTVKRVAGPVVVATVDRSDLVAVQTPQGFRREVLAAAHAAAPDWGATDDAALVEAIGGRVVVVPGAPEAFKVTTGWDLLLAEAVVAARD